MPHAIQLARQTGSFPSKRQLEFDFLQLKAPTAHEGCLLNGRKSVQAIGIGTTGEWANGTHRLLMEVCGRKVQDPIDDDAFAIDLRAVHRGSIEVPPMHE